MDHTNLQAIFSHATEFDSTLSLNPTHYGKILKKHISSVPYSHSVLFSNMADGEVSIFEDFLSPLRLRRDRNEKDKTDIVLNSFLQADLPNKIRVKTGRAKTEKYFLADELVDKWLRKRSIMNATDFHFRNTSIECCIDPKRLSKFNLYPQFSEVISDLEMMTLVVSSVGAFSDSHSDDSDGSNHCFTGKKLWLAWDTNEGLDSGLEDLEKSIVYSTSKFDIDAWLSLKSACWFTVETGQTLFMPGHLTHKVITLEPYLGVGSFYIAFPNALRTLSRWLLHEPNWQRIEAASFEQALYPEIIQQTCNKAQLIQKGSITNQQKCGFDFLEYAANSWKRQFSPAQRSKIISAISMYMNGIPFLEYMKA